MANDSTELHTLGDGILGDGNLGDGIPSVVGRGETGPRPADQFTVHEADSLDEVEGLITALVDLDPAEAAEPASRISEMLGSALDEEDH